MLNLRIVTQPANKMRYPTCGDYIEDGLNVIFYIVEMPNWKWEALVAVHELVEYFLVKAFGIKVADIDAFDIQFERERAMGIHSDTDEPGDDPKAPYHLYHGLATGVERCLAAMLGVCWADYDAYLAGIVYRPMKVKGKK